MNSGDTIYFGGSVGDAASLFATSGNWDTVYGVGAVVTLTNAQAYLMDDDQAAYFNGGTGASVTAYGHSDLFSFAAMLGQSRIGGFDATDKVQFKASDFANFAAMFDDSTQSGADTLIKLDATDSLTLTNVTRSTLTASEFSFV